MVAKPIKSPMADDVATALAKCTLGEVFQGSDLLNDCVQSTRFDETVAVLDVV